MDTVPQRLSRWWVDLSPAERRRASVLVVIALGYIGHYLVFCLPQPFFIEDAGISFAFARHLVQGEGLVTYAGGEHVEGYSNALWTFLVAAFYALGVPTWTSAKVMGAVFGVLTLGSTYGLVRRVRPDGRGEIALLAPLMLAASTQFVVWNSSGLENSLFGVLLSTGLWRLVVESQEDDRRPISAFLFFLLSMTRPEGLMYVLIALLGRTMAAVQRRRFLPLLGWLAVFLVPWALYNGWRYWYFAWAFPNTYYAKLGKGHWRPFNWNGGAWKYTKNWYSLHHAVYLLPLLGIATLGIHRRWRAVSLGVLLAVLSVLVFWNGKAGLPALPAALAAVQGKWVVIRVWALLSAAVLVGLGVFGRRSWLPRGLLWMSFSAAQFFVLYARGDWMDGFRWYNIVVIPLVPLLAIGLGDLLDALPLARFELGWPSVLGARLPRWLDRRVGLRAALLVLAGGLWIAGESQRSYEFAMSPETSVRDIHRRVRYMSWVQKRLDVDHITLLDVDMGAHLMFTDWDIIDIAGLVDVPMGQHQDFNKKFIHQYLFEEREPDFAHVHGGWARTSKIPTHPEWKQDFIEIPGYPIGRNKLHIGNHINKKLFVRRATELVTPDAVRFQGGVRMTALDLPSPEVAPGGRLFVDSEWAAGFREAGFRIVAFLYDDQGVRTAAVLPPGYDWYDPDEWKSRERVAGRYRMHIPDSLPQGSYSFGVVLLDAETGAVMPPVEQAPQDAGTVYMAGEYLTGLRVDIVSADQAEAAAERKREEALALATSGKCESVWSAWKDATRHIMRDTDWRSAHEPEIKTALAGCWVARAGAARSPEAMARALVRGRYWDHHRADLLKLSRPLAATYDELGDVAFADQRWGDAYDAYAMAMKLDPSRAWTRRKAEDARDNSLGIIRPSRKPRK